MSDIDAIRRRLDAASPGPWEKVDGVDTISYDSAYPYIFIMAPSGEIVAQLDDNDNHADARLIANAPTDITALLAEVDRLNSAVDQCMDENDRLTTEMTAAADRLTHIVATREWETPGHPMNEWCKRDVVGQVAAQLRGAL